MGLSLRRNAGSILTLLLPLPVHFRGPCVLMDSSVGAVSALRARLSTVACRLTVPRRALRCVSLYVSWACQEVTNRRSSTSSVSGVDVMSSGVSGVVRNGGSNPVWTAGHGWEVPLQFGVAPPDTAHMMVQVYDKDMFTDDLIGVATVDVTKYLDRAIGSFVAEEMVCVSLAQWMRKCVCMVLTAAGWDFWTVTMLVGVVEEAWRPCSDGTAGY